MTIVRVAGSVLAALWLAGCATGSTGSVTPVEGGMSGRWLLAAPNAPSCGMNFSGGPGAREGRLAPEGGCPGRFFMSRRWSFGSSGLSIVDDDGQTLATLSYANGRFEGQAAGGLPVTLTPPALPPG